MDWKNHTSLEITAVIKTRLFQDFNNFSRAFRKYTRALNLSINIFFLTKWIDARDIFLSICLAYFEFRDEKTMSLSLKGLFCFARQAEKIIRTKTNHLSNYNTGISIRSLRMQKLIFMKHSHAKLINNYFLFIQLCIWIFDPPDPKCRL